MIQGVIDNSEWRWVFIAGALLLVILSIPFAWAYAAAAPHHVFMGILVNPIDGASYLAKMYQGYDGHWLFRLPYTPEAHSGVAIFTFYLALGHVARLLHLEPILIFHAARLVGGMFMFISLYRFAADWTDSIEQRRVTWLLTVLGAGFGWLSLFSGYATPDLLRLPEGFPLQAVYANPHFPWAIAVAAALAHLLVEGALTEPLLPLEVDTRTIALATASIILSSISPFVLVPMGVGYGILCLWLWIRTGRFPRKQAARGGIVIVFSLPIALYDLWAFSSQNPVFQEWMRQNATLSPPVWEYLVAYGPLLILAGLAVWVSRRSFDAGDGFLLGWIIVTAVMLYGPLQLQRRFAMGLMLPLGVYAARGLWRVLAASLGARWRIPVIVGMYLSFLPTTVLAIAIPLIGTTSIRSDSYYITIEEDEALQWLGASDAPNDVVLASPTLSLFVPEVGPRVVYGHPFETLKADERRQEVLDYYAGRDCSIVTREHVSYVIVGPQERMLPDAADTCLPTGAPVFEANNSAIAIYAVGR